MSGPSANTVPVAAAANAAADGGHVGAAGGNRYGLPAVALHWLQAALVLWLLWLGWTMVELPKGAERSAAYGLHKSLGLVALALVLVRLAVRRRCPPPAPLATGREALLARAAHLALYALLLALPLAGFLASSYTPYAMKFFGLALPRLAGPDEALNAFFKDIHFVAGRLLVALLLLHIAAAIRHAWRGDGTLRRMLPRLPSRN